MEKRSRGAWAKCVLLALGAVAIAACNDSASPTAPQPPAENAAAAPGGANLVAGSPGAAPAADGETGATRQAVAIERAAKNGDADSDSDSDSDGNGKAEVCHQEGNGGYHTLNVSRAAVPAHIGHGDWLVEAEACDGMDNDCDGLVDEDDVCGAPDIDLEKATNGHDADAAPGPSLQPGDAIVWTYVVTNLGNVPLENVLVADDQGVAVSCPKTSLEVGESMTCTGSGSAGVGQYMNVGTASGQSSFGQQVSDSDPSHYYGEEPPPACATQTDIDDFTVTFLGATVGGGTTTFEYCIENVGGLSLSHWTLEACFTEVDLLGCSPGPCFWTSGDPTTAVVGPGVKFDDLDLSMGQSECYSLTLQGDWSQSIGDVTAGLKYSIYGPGGAICGPQCD